MLPGPGRVPRAKGSGSGPQRSADQYPLEDPAMTSASPPVAVRPELAGQCPVDQGAVVIHQPW
jgi:hypothetical protein